MAVYDVQLTDEGTSQVLQFRLQARDRKAAEEEARRRAESFRFPPPAGTKRKALVCTWKRQLTQAQAIRWLKTRLKAEGRLEEMEKFRIAAGHRLFEQYPTYGSGRLRNMAYMEAFHEFSSEYALISQEAGCPPISAIPTAVAEVEARGKRARVLLLKSSLSLSERGRIQDDVEWVYQNLDVDWYEIQEESAPSPGAVALLSQAKEDKKWFLQTYHAKLLPTKAKIESDDWHDVDDGQVAEMVGRIREERALEEVGV